jgi:DNA-binding LacI/PurR family transcriptional regulator
MTSGAGSARSAPRPPAMSDVAAAAGVSHQTVSRVLNDHPSVRPQTRDRVLEAIELLGYRRNSIARALVTRRSATIGVVTGASGLFGPTSTLVALEVAAREAGYFVSVATINTFDATTMRQSLEYFLGQGVEGIVIVAPQVEVTQAAESFDAPVPVVMITSSEHTHTLASVSVDNRAGGRAATRHLIDAGHREIVHLAGPQDWYDAQDRLIGWQQECEEAGLAVPEPILGDWEAGRGYDVGRQLLREGLPTAVFAANDQLALGLLRAFWEGGARVPQDVSVVGFDDSAGTAYFIPPLTTVRQEFASLGTATIRSLRAALDGEHPDRVVIPTTLVVRESSTLHD